MKVHRENFHWDLFRVDLGEFLHLLFQNNLSSLKECPIVRPIYLLRTINEPRYVTSFLFRKIFAHIAIILKYAIWWKWLYCNNISCIGKNYTGMRTMTINEIAWINICWVWYYVTNDISEHIWNIWNMHKCKLCLRRIIATAILEIHAFLSFFLR